MATAAETAAPTATDDLRAKAQPHIDTAKAFVKKNKWASYATAGVIGLALLNTLRGKR